MSEKQRALLGLPSFTESRYVHYAHYPVEVYDFIQQWQKAKGFDHRTTDFARSLGYPILEILPQDGDCFENVAEVDKEDIPDGSQYEDMEVELLVDDARANDPLSPLTPEPLAQTDMNVDAATEDMEVDG
ncbi:hypothetical protein V5O48_017735 [Marasmius crinis-equi]|uniref:Uncharacterized protein n=1 Tax=Marasmius crinis-equi TaxID=585013 RepID=A0ABR3EN47_9AGAR